MGELCFRNKCQPPIPAETSIQELKTDKQTSGQMDDTGQEITQLREATQQDASTYYVENTLEAFRTEVRESIKELKAPNSMQELPQSYTTVTKVNAAKPIYVAISPADEQKSS